MLSNKTRISFCFMPIKLILLVALVEIELLIRAIHPKQRDKKEKQI